MKKSALALCLLLESCATPKLPLAADAELIKVQTDPGFCMGACTSWELTAASNGKALFVIKHNDEIIRYSPIRLLPWQFEQLHAALATYRPHGDRFLMNEACSEFYTDMGGVHVEWQGRGAPARLYLNDGCDPKIYARMRQRILSVAKIVGATDLPNPSAGVVASTRIK